MIYQTGTITTTAGQTKIKGTGTRWKDNLAGISEGCPISYLINNVVYMNTVLSVNSDTEINLTYPVPVAASAAKYQIATFVLDSMSDGVRKMLANQQYIQYFLRNMDTWMTQDGIVEIKTPTGETVRLESIIALKKLIDGKFDKTGGEVGSLTIFKSGNSYPFIALKRGDGAAVYLEAKPDEQVPMAQLYRRDKDGKVEFNISFPKATGTAMLVGDYGFGTNTTVVLKGEELKSSQPCRTFRQGGGASDDTNTFSAWGCGLIIPYDTLRHAGIFYDFQKESLKTYSKNNQNIINVNTLYGTSNTIKDAQGNLRAASPVIKIFTDYIELNDESEGIELEKLGTGRYKLKGTLGMNSDASWGGYNGGLVAPLGINGLELLWVDYKVLSDGDIIIETNYRKHSDLPPPVLLKRLITYPEFMDENGDELESYAPVDIPNGHWIDVRVNMPSDSIYNQKLAEAERLAKIEAERVAKEEAEKAAREEAERLEEESKQEQASKLEE
ncbi:TPA: hypothetical protein ACS70C_001012 [Providencia alcalifaciens]